MNQVSFRERCSPSHLKCLPAVSKTMTRLLWWSSLIVIWNWAAPSLMPGWEVRGLARKEKKEKAGGE